MGHYIYLKHMNLEPKAPVFIPFVGAFVAMKNLPKERIVSAWSAFWGPCLGGIIAGLLLPIGLATHSQLLVVLSVYGVGLNLLQLTPSRPLDGGFIAETIWKWLTIPGSLMLLAGSFMLHSGFLGLLALVGFVRGIRIVMGREKNKMTEATVPERLKLAAATVVLSGCLIGTLVVGIANIHVKPKSVSLPGSHASASEKPGLDQSDPEHAQLQQLVGVE
jgi:Zn-dependent protease